MPVAPASKRVAPPSAPPEQRAWARRANAVLIEQELPGQEVAGDHRLELRWVVIDAVPAQGEKPARPAVGEWHLCFRTGLQTARDFGTPKRPAPIVLGKASSPQQAWRKAQRHLDTERIRTMNDGTRFTLSHHLKAAHERLIEQDRVVRKAQQVKDRRQERLAWHRARATQPDLKPSNDRVLDVEPLRNVDPDRGSTQEDTNVVQGSEATSLPSQPGQTQALKPTRIRWTVRAEWTRFFRTFSHR